MPNRCCYSYLNREDAPSRSHYSEYQRSSHWHPDCYKPTHRQGMFSKVGRKWVCISSATSPPLKKIENQERKIFANRFSLPLNQLQFGDEIRVNDGAHAGT